MLALLLLMVTVSVNVTIMSKSREGLAPISKAPHWLNTEKKKAADTVKGSMT